MHIHYHAYSLSCIFIIMHINFYAYSFLCIFIALHIHYYAYSLPCTFIHIHLWHLSVYISYCPSHSNTQMNTDEQGQTNTENIQDWRSEGIYYTTRSTIHQLQSVWLSNGFYVIINCSDYQDCLALPSVHWANNNI